MALVLVTGASGFIAAHIVKLLQEQGYRVRGTVRSLQNEVKVKPLRELCPGAKYPLELVEADLTSPDGWPEAVKDCDYVLHTASPVPPEEPKHEDELLKPAVEGTLVVLKACRGVKSIKRVVVTSSGASVTNFDEERQAPYTEEDWNDPKHKGITAYMKSKVMAEMAAWDYVKELPEGERFELATVQPTLVLGPVLSGPVSTSGELIKRFLEKGMPMIPPINMGVVDVRDVAAAHLAAMRTPEAAGKRHIADCESMWFKDIAKILDDEFKSQGYKVPGSVAPYWLLWVFGRCDKTTRMMLPFCGVTVKFDNTRMTSVLGIQPRSLKDTVLDMAYSMIESGKIVKKSGYRGPATTQK